MSAGGQHRTTLLRLQCITCARYFRNQSGLTKHRRTAHHRPPPLPPQPPPTHDTPANSSENIDLPGNPDSLRPVLGVGDDVDMVSADADDTLRNAALEGDGPGMAGTAYHPEINGQNLLVVCARHLLKTAEQGLHVMPMATFYHLICPHLPGRNRQRMIGHLSITEWRSN